MPWYPSGVGGWGNLKAEQHAMLSGRIGLETEAPSKPETETEDPAQSPDKSEEEELGERVRRIIREIPNPTPQPGGQ